MTQQEARHIAIGATRSYLRSMGYTTDEMTAQDALAAIDDIARSEPGTIAGEWFINASDNQIKLYKREWRAWQKRGY
jgi:hypothetical protein